MSWIARSCTYHARTRSVLPRRCLVSSDVGSAADWELPRRRDGVIRTLEFGLASISGGRILHHLRRSASAGWLDHWT